MKTNNKIIEYCQKLSEFLCKKNDDYGDSLQNPIQVFQKSKIDGILGRIDDKINRIKSVGINDVTEDTVEDLIGYLIHLKIMIDDKNKRTNTYKKDIRSIYYDSTATID